MQPKRLLSTNNRMKKYLLYLCLITISLAGCSKHHTDPQPQQIQPSNTDTVGGKYLPYLKIDTVYDYYSATQFYLDVTHETLTGDTLYLKAGTANQVIQPNPIAGYDPKVALDDTLYVTKNPNSAGYKFTGSSNSNKLKDPGSSINFYILNKNTIKMVYRYRDLDNPPGFWTDTHGWYFKKM
jgi:hypothetical protein